MRLPLILLFTVSVLLSAFAQEKKDALNGRAVIKEMYKRYKNKWYRKLTFTQQTIFYNEGELDREETWYEVISMPNGLAIKFGELNSGNGITFKSDSQFVWRDDKIVSKTSSVHELLVLGFSVYFDTPEKTIAKLEQSGYDFDHFEIDVKENGKTEFSIGDPGRCRFWIDTETFLFTRLERRDKAGNIIETKFNNYQRIGKGWLATEVVFLKNGKPLMTERYKDIKVPKNLPDNILSTTGVFSEVVW
jgi:outer membrane lipoprotein-sorting protein